MIESGRMLFVRLGGLSGKRQKHQHAETSHPPPKGCRKGIWAFPWPCHEMFFMAHQYENAIPINLRTWDPLKFGRQVNFDYFGDDWVVRQEAMSKAKKIIKMRRFWHSGPVYTHFTPNREVCAFNQWFLTDIDFLDREVQVALYNYRNRLVRSFFDHLEVFIPRGD